MPWFGKPTSHDYGDFKGLSEKPIQIDNKLFKGRNPLGVEAPFLTTSLYSDSFQPFKIGDATNKEPQLEKVNKGLRKVLDKAPRYAGEFDTEYAKHDGATCPKTDDGRKPKCCHVRPGEKCSMLASSAVRMMRNDPKLASQVLDI